MKKPVFTRTPVIVFSLSFILITLVSCGLFSLKSGLLRNAVDCFLLRGEESVSLQDGSFSCVNMDKDAEEEPFADGEASSIRGIWIKQGDVASGIFFSIEGMHAKRLTVEFSEPLEEHVVVNVGIQHNEEEDYDWTATWEQRLNKGSAYAFFRLQNAESAQNVCISFDGDGYVRLPVSDVVINSTDWHLRRDVQTLPWFYIFLVAAAISYIVTLWVTGKIKKRYLPTSLVLAFVLGLVLYQKYLCGGPSLLYATWDGFSQYLPTYINYSHLLHEYGYLPRWSFSVGFGSMMSYDVLLYPFNIVPVVVGALFGDSALEQSFIWLHLIKIELAVLFMFLFLRELKLKSFVCACMSIVYAFCGIMVLRGNWIFLADEVFLSVMLLWAVERYFRRGRWAWIPPVIYLLATCLGAFYLYLYALLLIVYATVRFVYANGKLKEYPAFILKCGLLFVIGAMLWSVILVGFSWTLFQTVRFGDTVNYFSLSRIFERATWDVLLSAILRTFSTDILGVFDQYTGFSNYLEGPLFYCGTICLFLVPQAIRSANKKQRRLIGVGLLLIVLYMVFPFITDVTCAFIRNEENGLRSYRISSEWICVLAVVISAFGLDRALRQKEFSDKTAAVTGIALLGVLGLFLMYLPEYGYVANKSAVRLVVGAIICWLVVLSYFRSNAKWRRLLFAVAVLEAFAFSRMTINQSYQTALSYYQQMQKDDMGYYSSVPRVVAELKQEDAGLYRIGGIDPQTGGARYCAAQYFGIHDSAYYTSIDKYNYEVLHALYPEAFDTGLGSKNAVSASSDGNMATLTGYKYYLSCTDRIYDTVPGCFEYLKTIENIDVYVNPNAYSIGTTYDRCMSSEAFLALPVESRRQAALECLVMDDTSDGWLQEAADFEAATELGEHSPLLIEQWKPNHIVGTVKADENCMMLFTIPNIQGWTVYVDGEKADVLSVDFGFFGVRLTPGQHSITLRYTVRSFTLGLIISLLSLAGFVALIWFARDAKWLRAFVKKCKVGEAAEASDAQEQTDVVQTEQLERTDT